MKPNALEFWEHVRQEAPSCGTHWMPPEFQKNLVSVIVPTFNRAHFLLDCLQSVLDQTYRPIELILVDDGSTDSTNETVERWRAALPQDENLSFVFIPQKNQGANVARNRGLVESRGEYVQFLDSDDLLLPDKVRRGVEAILKNNADYVYCPVLYRDEGLQEIPGGFGVAMTGGDADITTYLWQTMCPLYCRDLVRRVGPWLETIFYGDDWEYACRVKLLSKNGVFYATPGGLLRIHPRPERGQLRNRMMEYRAYHTAYCNVFNMAKVAGRLSPTICNRLARRFFLNALFFGKAGDDAMRAESLKRTKELLPLPMSLKAAIRLFSAIRNRWIDALAVNVLLRANKL